MELAEGLEPRPSDYKAQPRVLPFTTVDCKPSKPLFTGLGEPRHYSDFYRFCAGTPSFTIVLCHCIISA